jgi:nucleotide-binding universal stress UspA family protein
MKQVIARIYPLTNTPVIFDVDSRAEGNGRLKAFMNGKDVEVGYDFYMHTEHLPADQALQVAQAYAKHINLPEHDILVRQRFPKTKPLPRKLNDANLVLVQKDEQKKGQPESLQQLAQEMHDKETKKPEQKASADKPEGAVVKRSAEEKKRAYNKKTNKRSEAAMKRYLAELGQVAAESPTLLQPVVPGPGVTQAEIDDATMQLAIKLAKLLKNVM